jgi:hypothetical protein
MTVNAARRPRRRGVAQDPGPVLRTPVDTLQIGEINQTVFDCPNCARPLALGARRCPGCGTHLIIGVPMRKASILAATGLALGLIVGAAGGVVFAAKNLAAAPGQGLGVPGPSAAPIAVGPSSPTPRPTASPAPPSPTPAPPTPDSMPSLARSALTQSITVDAQLAATRTSLEAAVAAAPFSASDVAQILRTVSADAVYGQQLADRVSGWPDSATVGADLAAAYGSIHDAAASALVASVRNEASYRDSARSMIVLIAALAAVDGQARDLAAAHGVTLPESSGTP